MTRSARPGRPSPGRTCSWRRRRGRCGSIPRSTRASTRTRSSSTPEIHVGIATALADGLVSPAITNTDQRSLEELVSERKRLRAGAAEGKLRGVELFGATFTISNLGPFGIDRFRALVIPPQAAILAAGRVAEHGGRLTQSLTLSADHRVLDGAPGAQFLTTICGLLETPEWLMELAPAGIAAGTA